MKTDDSGKVFDPIFVFFPPSTERTHSHMHYRVDSVCK